MKSYDVTIQMKALCLYLHMVLFFFLNEICKLTQNLPLASFGSEKVNGLLLQYYLGLNKKYLLS